MFGDWPVHLFKDAAVSYQEQWIAAETATELFTQLRASLNWQQQPIRMFGRMIMQPRLTAWYGDQGAAYTYSGLKNEPLPWTAELSALRKKLEQETGFRFNSVLCNCYRSGTDSMGWHSDDEKELGADPVIASVSLGQSRRFLLRNKTNHSQKHTLLLGHGSLLLMHGETQRNWQHSLPRTYTPCNERINLTFRQI
ncbi:MAG: alpha-ketoglutarate-dependent dioxygenase AlkB family protein, partial [Bacteroidia bacterium]